MTFAEVNMARRTVDRTRIAEAAEWRLLGLLFERPHGSWRADLSDLAREVEDPDLRATVSACGAVTEGAYLRLIGPGGQVSPREVTYQPFTDPGQLLAQLANCYDAFAFRPHIEEPIDHIAVELAFVGYLLLKEAYAAAQGDAAGVRTTARARRSFIGEHLAPFAATFFQRLAATPPSYLVLPAQLLCARLPARSVSELRLPIEADSGTCGACTLDDV
jgi:hypothetical protein